MDRSIEIAGRRTVGDWLSIKEKIISDFDNKELWNDAFDFFFDRIHHRYIYPTETIQKSSKIIGEGFAISAILCSLIEALETFYQGKSYKRNPPRNEHEYYKSSLIFKSLLTNREPFCKYFDADLAKNFYENFRCPLLHEAATRKGWKIRIDTTRLIEKEDSGYILNRVLFIDAVKEFIEIYRKELLSSREIKKAYIRKMNFICSTA